VGFQIALTFPSFVTPSSYNSTGWQWILAEQMVFMLKILISEHTPQSAGFVINMALYKAL
jgi:hypothetical protein